MRGPFELPIARAVADVSAEIEASPVDAVMEFVEDALGHELLPWQRELVAQVYAGRRPTLGLRYGRRRSASRLLELLEDLS